MTTSRSLSDAADTQGNMAQTTTVVLLGRGMPHGEQWGSLQAQAQDLRQSGRYFDVRVAFLEMTEPALADVLADIETSGARRVVVVPCFVPFDRNVAGWLARSLSARRTKGAIGLEVVMAPALDRSPHLAQAVSEALEIGLAEPDVAQVVRPLVERPRRGQIPPHRDQVFVCLGPRCTEAGAWDVLARLRSTLRRDGLDVARREASNRVLVCRSSCLWPCLQAPVLIVQPDNVWYGPVQAGDVDEIVETHLLGRQPVERLRLGVEPTEDHPEDWPLAQIRQQHVVANGMFARVAMQHAGALAVFGRLACVDGVTDRLIGASSPLARSAGIHGPGMPHAQLTSRFGDWPVSEVQPIVLEPGGLHLMLFDLKRDLSPGESLPLALHFEQAGIVAVDVTLQPGA